RTAPGRWRRLFRELGARKGATRYRREGTEHGCDRCRCRRYSVRDRCRSRRSARHPRARSALPETRGDRLMSNELKKTNSTALTTDDKNAYELYAENVDQQMIVGELLKFSKGDYLVGRDGEECSDKELVGAMPGFAHGWIRWEDNHPVEHVMGLLIEGFVPPERSTLGHLDKAMWELNKNNGEPRDPWQLGLYLPMVTVNGERVYTFSSTSDGGRRRCMAPLCREY